MSIDYIDALSIIVWIVCGSWIYFDAQKRNLKDPFAWGFLGFFLGILGLAGYWWWVIRPNKRNS